MKNYVVTERKLSVKLEDTKVGCWATDSDSLLYLTLDEGYACFLHDGQVVYLHSDRVDETEVHPLLDNATITFTQRQVGETVVLVPMKQRMVETTPENANTDILWSRMFQ